MDVQVCGCMLQIGTAENQPIPTKRCTQTQNLWRNFYILQEMSTDLPITSILRYFWSETDEYISAGVLRCADTIYANTKNKTF